MKDARECLFFCLPNRWFDKGPVINHGEGGGATKRDEEVQVKFYPHKTAHTCLSSIYFHTLF